MAKCKPETSLSCSISAMTQNLPDATSRILLTGKVTEHIFCFNDRCYRVSVLQYWVQVYFRHKNHDITFVLYYFNC